MIRDELGKLLVQGSLTGGVGGLLVYLLTLPQRRRKISAGATVDEAKAASTLSGEALRWVEEARAEARDARAVADRCRLDAVAAEQRHREELDDLEDRYRAELAGAHGRIDALERRERDLEDVIRELGGVVPPHRRGYDQRPTPRRTVRDDDPAPPQPGGTT